jgi:hypothetical protein
MRVVIPGRSLRIEAGSCECQQNHCSVAHGNRGYKRQLAVINRSGLPMQWLYFSLAALHIVALIATGILWTILDLGHGLRLRPHLRDIRAVHFGSLYLVPWFLVRL